MKILVEIDEARFKDIQRIAEVQLERNHFRTAEQIIANGTPLPKGLIPINDVMSVFDDFMCGDVDEDDMETFYEMLKERVIEADKEGAEE